MDSLLTAPMSTSHSVTVLHLEPTDVCQAACPACARETDREFDKSQRHHLKVDQILQHIDSASIATLDKMFMCGNYGDPAAGQHTMEIFRYFRDVNPTITLGMNTNGAIQDREWWQALGKLFQNPGDYVVFSIDGLADTNDVYRRGVVWEWLIQNVKAYIATGAAAHWDMLVYRHNEHQVEACERLAKDLGFSWFRAKVSRRPLQNGLQFPVIWKTETCQTTRIDCHAIREQSIYIDAQGRRSPCCWLGGRQNNFVTDISEVMQTWQTPNPHPVCASTCGQTSNQTNFSAQWRREVQLC